MNSRFLSTVSVCIISVCCPFHAQTSALLDPLKIGVSEEENRSVSFTNKEAAYYYTQSHHNNHPDYSYFAGMNISKNRIFHGYELYANQVLQDNKGAKVEVFPYKMVRTQQNGLQEELWMFDHINGIEVGIFSSLARNIGIKILGEQITPLKSDEEFIYFKSMEGDFVIAVAAKNTGYVSTFGNLVSARSDSGGFYIAAAKSAEEATRLILDLRKNAMHYKKERIAAMENLLDKHVRIKSSTPNFEKALNWIELTMDQLVTHQQGYGIYAGVPWFNEYWGRDEFISLPGAVLVTGRFDTARQILKSFAEYQNTDPDSRFFGRVPNIVNPQNIDYHTTDGTPRFVGELLNYVKYSGDTSVISELYPNVKNSIEGALKYWTDDKGYLLHEDNETWMDARDKNLVSYSPRGNRANDIQALWYHQLQAGIYFAGFMKDSESARKWKQTAEKVKHYFEQDFVDSSYPYLADRLTEQGKPEFTIRPNQLFALDLISDKKIWGKAIHTSWTELVYPWGTATLDKKNPFFHPFHHTEDYFFDEAYHNGIVWPWLNGISMQRMIEAGHTDIAYQLFKNTNEMAMTMGCVGGVSENLDAFPRKGKTWPNLSGTYLQAWSNAEQLRVWYQYFLGIRPDMPQKHLTLAPRIPSEIQDLEYSFVIGNEFCKATYGVRKLGARQYQYELGNQELDVNVDLFPYQPVSVRVTAGSELMLAENGKNLIMTVKDPAGREIQRKKIRKSKSRIKEETENFSILNGVQFAKPDALGHHPVIKNTDQ